MLLNGIALVLFVSTSVLAAPTQSSTKLKLATREGIVERLRSTRTLRKRDSPSGIPPPATEATYSFVDEKDGWTDPEYTTSTYWDGTTITFEEALSQCVTFTDTNNGDYFNLFYNNSDYYYCRVLTSGDHDTSEFTGPYLAVEESYLYQKSSAPLDR